MRGRTSASRLAVAVRQEQASDQERSFALNPIQYDFVYDDTAKYVAYIGGLGAGKSYAGGVKALRYMLEHPGSFGAICAPNYPQLRDSTMRSFFGDVLPPALVASWTKTEGVLRLKNGSECMFRSMDDPDRRRGPNLAWFWLDEGPLCGYYAWKVMKGRLRQADFPVQGWITGTPKGEDEFYEDFESDPKPNHHLYRASTLANAHNLPDGYIEDLGYTGQFALQEIEGLFVNFEGLVYELRREWHIGEWPGVGTDGHVPRPALRIGGIDWGFKNPAVALPIWVDHDNRAYVRDEFYQRGVGRAGIVQACAQFTRDYGIATWYCGPDEPESIAELNAMFGAKQLNARAVAATDDVIEGINSVRAQMALRADNTAGLLLSATCAMTRSEMRTYAYESDRHKRDPQEKPLKKFDHAMDALRYAVHSALGGRGRHRDVDQKANARLRESLTDIGGIKILRKVF